MDLYPSPSRSCSSSLTPSFHIPLSLLLVPSISASFFGNCSSSSYSLPLPSRRSRFSPSFSLSHPTLGLVLVPLTFQRFFSLRLAVPSRARYAMFRLPNTDPSRTNDRTPPFSSPAAHTINHFYLSLSFLSKKPRARGAPFAKDFPDLSHLRPRPHDVLPHPPSAS